MPDTLLYTGKLTVINCWCGMRFAVPAELREYQLREYHDGKSPTGIYCPLGHSSVPAGTTDAERLEKQLQRERQRLDQSKEHARQLQNTLNAEKAAKSRLQNRISNGVCPCCQRSFLNLKRHMNSQHPGFAGATA